MASAVSRMSWSETLQANLFQLFQPIGGVLAGLLFKALIGQTDDQQEECVNHSQLHAEDIPRRIRPRSLS